jgi:hypothetical protein
MCDSDMYQYIFVMPDSENGADVNSKRPATLESNAPRNGAPFIDSESVLDKHPAMS